MASMIVWSIKENYEIEAEAKKNPAYNILLKFKILLGFKLIKTNLLDGCTSRRQRLTNTV